METALLILLGVVIGLVIGVLGTLYAAFKDGVYR